jgi:hypothetical protein
LIRHIRSGCPRSPACRFHSSHSPPLPNDSKEGLRQNLICGSQTDQATSHTPGDFDRSIIDTKLFHLPSSAHLQSVMKPPLTADELKSAVTKSLGRQHLLGAVPASQRFLPLAAFAVSDVLAQRYGNEMIERLMVGDIGKDAAISLPQVNQLETRSTGEAKSTLPETCLTCSRIPVGQDVHPTKAVADLAKKKAWTSGGPLSMTRRRSTVQQS